MINTVSSHIHIHARTHTHVHKGWADVGLAVTWQRHEDFAECIPGSTYDHQKCWNAFSTFQGGNATQVSPYTNGDIFVGTKSTAIDP